MFNHWLKLRNVKDQREAEIKYRGCSDVRVCYRNKEFHFPAETREM